MAFKDYNQIVEPLVLPINGKSYTIPPVSVAGGIRLEEGLGPDTENPVPDEEFKQIVLGTALDEMRADSVRPEAIKLAAMTALADHQVNRGAAEIMWESNGDPKALEDRQKAVTNRTTRRATPRAAATTTPRRASGSGTKTSRKS